MTLIAFDGTVPRHSGGRVEPGALPWLEAALAVDPERPTLLMPHHPSFHTGIGHMDQQGLENAALLEAVVRRHPQIERVLCGHLHRHITRRFGGTIAMTAPGPAHQVALDLDPQAASRFRMEPPGFCCTGGIRCMGWLPMRRRLGIMGRCIRFLMRGGG